ncbi:MAG TPA: hypothetical protein RMH99_04690 [Sandaracinaceae bacterium LLY-WYZ-13_1]|nr:hypothetical protein [Sandaracinaceae bacterium LLY-WYZ-13_1]
MILRKRPSGGTAGVVYVEFLLAFFPVFILFMGVAQLVLLYAARLVVHHAAVRSTRAAVVIAHDDPQYYDGLAVGDLGGRTATAEDVLHALSRGGVPGAGAGGGVRPPPSRRSAIETSAALVVLPLAGRGDVSLGGAVGSGGLRDAVDRTMARLTVTFPGIGEEPVPHDGEIAVRVAYRYPCNVPIARRLICGTGASRDLESQLIMPAQGAQFAYEGWSP